MSIKFRKDAEAMGFTPLSDRDRIKTIYIYSENEHSISFFGFMSVLIGLSITLPVINTVRTMTVEKATILVNREKNI